MKKDLTLDQQALIILENLKLLETLRLDETQEGSVRNLERKVLNEIKNLNRISLK